MLFFGVPYLFSFITFVTQFHFGQFGHSIVCTILYILLESKKTPHTTITKCIDPIIEGRSNRIDDDDDYGWKSKRKTRKQCSIETLSIMVTVSIFFSVRNNLLLYKGNNCTTVNISTVVVCVLVSMDTHTHTLSPSIYPDTISRLFPVFFPMIYDASIYFKFFSLSLFLFSENKL